MPEDIRPEILQKTQKTLGKYVKKPPLTEKLLSKPPFRFLHDIINAVIKETGFLNGLFSENELKSENFKERDAKVAFLTKLIDAVKIITKTELAVRPSKIVAGLEPAETNLLLQTIGKAIEKKLDSSDYVKQLHEGKIVNNDKKKTRKSTDKSSDKPKKPSSKEIVNNKIDEKKTVSKIREKKSTGNETPKSTDRNKIKTTPRDLSKSKKTHKSSKEVPTTKLSKEKLDKTKSEKKIIENTPQTIEKSETPKSNTEIINENITESSKVSEEIKSNKEDLLSNLSELKIETTNEITEDKIRKEPTPAVNEELNNTVIKKPGTSVIRPKSARPKSGELKEIIKSQNVANEPITTEDTSTPQRPKSSLRPPSVRPSSARPGAPRLRPDSAIPVQEVVTLGKINVIVENFDKDDPDDEETVVIQNAPEIVDDLNSENITNIGENKGHLVEQILEQINDKEEVEKPTTEIDDGIHTKSTSKDISQLRNLLQTLTKTANPLGKLMNYLHEDIDAMQSELEMWINTKKQLSKEIAKQKKISTEMNKPLLGQLEILKDEIQKQEQEIINIRNNILRNESRIKELLLAI